MKFPMLVKSLNEYVKNRSVINKRRSCPQAVIVFWKYYCKITQDFTGKQTGRRIELHNQRAVTARFHEKDSF